MTGATAKGGPKRAATNARTTNARTTNARTTKRPATSAGGAIAATDSQAAKRLAAARQADDRTVKVSVALPRRLWEEARAAVGEGSLSALVTAAVRRELAGRRTDAMLAELDTIHGPVPADVKSEVDAQWGPVFDAMARRQG